MSHLLVSADANRCGARRRLSRRALGTVRAFRDAMYVVILGRIAGQLLKGSGKRHGQPVQGFAPLLVRAFFFCFKAVFGRALPVGASTYVDAAVVKGKKSHGCVVADGRFHRKSYYLDTSSLTCKSVHCVLVGVRVFFVLLQSIAPA